MWPVANTSTDQLWLRDSINGERKRSERKERPRRVRVGVKYGKPPFEVGVSNAQVKSYQC